MDILALEQSGVRIRRTRDFRIDSCEPLKTGSVEFPERQERLKEHTKRVRRLLEIERIFNGQHTIGTMQGNKRSQS